MKDGACENNSHTSSIDAVTNGINNMNISNNNNATTEAGITDSNISPVTSTSDCYKKVSKGSSKSNSALEMIGQRKNLSTADDIMYRYVLTAGKKVKMSITYATNANK